MKALPLLIVLALLTTHVGAQKNERKSISVGEPPTDHSPAAELASFKVLDGFEVNLFADESQGIANALAIRWDEKGRLWCLQTSAYPQPAPGELVNDKVIILEDTNGDGRADKQTVWADGLRMPMGMELGSPGQLYVGEGEKLLLLTDTDGDDRADQTEVILSGFGTADTHQNLNSFIWSPDGTLVMHQGLHCYSRVTTAWGVKQLYGAGFWRFWPHSRKLESYPTGMPLNAWGTAFTQWGQPVMVAGAAGMFWARPKEVSVPEVPGQHGIPYFLLSRFMMPNSGQIIKTSGLRKYCGVDIPLNAHWPNEMCNEVVAGGFFENAVYRYKLTADKENPSAFEAIEQPPLITSDNVAFRPVDVRFGPDGALYIADWYNPIIGHYQASFRHPNRDKGHGRIWRMTVKDKASARFTPLSAQMKTTELQEIAAGTDRWPAYQAMRLLRSLPWTEAIQGLTNDHSKQFLHLQLHEAYERPAPELAVPGDTAEEGFKAYTTHALGNWAGQMPEVLAKLEQRIGDESALVRLEAIVACAKVHKPEAIKVALMALDRPMDSFLDRALWLAVHATAPQWKPLLQRDDGGTSFLQSLPAHHLVYLMEKDGSAELLGMARGMMIKWETLSPELLIALNKVLVSRGGPEDRLRALHIGRTHPAVLNDLATVTAQRRFAVPEGAEAILETLLKTGGGDARIAACRLAGAWKLKSLADALRESGLDAQEAMPLRQAAIEGLGKLGESPETFTALMEKGQEPWPVRIAALTALTGGKAAQGGLKAAAMLDQVKDEKTMQAWLNPLLARAAAVQAFAASLDKNPCKPETAKLALTTLTMKGRSDATLTAVLSQIIGVKNVQPVYNPAWVQTLAAEVKSNGDAARGKAVFSSPLAGCVACHQIGKQGGIIGPELDAVGRGVPVELLIEAVVWPNRQIKEGYVATTLTMKDGRTLQGYRTAEDNGELELKDFLAGTLTRFPLTEIKDRQEAGSLMPEGLIVNLTREELRDLVAYLSSLGNTP
ncbi:putative membrane-bound dehydrogenase-like protein [Prosthecobacter fusiformis]|uniref:Putative membrane-bound dehydrogenase-like protein n=1 Tax=Prosthecobacter fusiformis TaxID=48464 RepID=A0A4V3FIB2_9BACT|nr:PVC-type heme-binding CxxCH protein [Prosthecobacter fusiformis]TDU81673.1 putative membrane-bound dehydrogenase-like protein [Prosthecobacter fusiformis]